MDDSDRLVLELVAAEQTIVFGQSPFDMAAPTTTTVVATNPAVAPSLADFVAYARDHVPTIPWDIIQDGDIVFPRPVAAGPNVIVSLALATQPDQVVLSIIFNLAVPRIHVTTTWPEAVAILKRTFMPRQNIMD
jgi:hypothetical protein